MRKKLLISLMLAIVLLTTGCQKIINYKTVLRVGCCEVPYHRILDQVKPILAQQGIKLQIVSFNLGLFKPNMELAAKTLDANLYQNKIFLKFYKGVFQNDNLVPICKVLFSPFEMYSPKYNFLNEVPDKAKVVIINNFYDKNRSLKLLKEVGLINFKNVLSFDPNNPEDNPKNLIIQYKDYNTVFEIAKNFLAYKTGKTNEVLPKNLRNVDLFIGHPLDFAEHYYVLKSLEKFGTSNVNYITMELERLIRTWKNVSYSVCYEKAENSPYITYLVARQDNKDTYAIQALARALRSPQIKAFIKKTYNLFFETV